MKYLPLILAGLWRKPARTIFTALSITVAFILFGILSGMDAGNAHALDAARLDRMFVSARFDGPLPYSYGARIAALPNILVVSSQSILAGYFRLRTNPAIVVPTEASYFAARPELIVTPQEIAALAHTRTGILAGVWTVQKYGWKIGDKVAINTRTPQRNGSRVWTFDVLGTVDNANFPGQANGIFANYGYFDDARATDKGTVGGFFVRVADPSRAADTARAIDGLFDNSPAPTRTSLEKADAEARLQSFGDVGFLTHSVVGAVLFMLLFLTGNTMMQSVRERIPEFGVLKTLGYSDFGVLALVLGESMLLCAVAGGVGLVLGKLCIPLIKLASGTSFSLLNFTGLLLLPWAALATGFGYALLVALVSAALPALRVKRLKVVDALAGR